MGRVIKGNRINMHINTMFPQATNENNSEPRKLDETGAKIEYHQDGGEEFTIKDGENAGKYKMFSSRQIDGFVCVKLNPETGVYDTVLDKKSTLDIWRERARQDIRETLRKKGITFNSL